VGYLHCGRSDFRAERNVYPLRRLKTVQPETEKIMRALCWHGKGDVRVDTVPDPTIKHPRDAIIKITACAICGSDLHLLDGYQPTMESGDILGHENMGEVIELGSEVKNLKKGDRVVVPFTISCGECWFCKKGLFSCCDRTNPNAEIARLTGSRKSG
jgi:threonine dehydrogenase-like Zn-dependent dehydrogenase